MKAAIALLFLSAVSAAAMPICDSGPRVNCVVDGDTVWLGGEKIRLSDIDAPELLSPKSPQEALWAAEARDRLAELLVGTVEVRREGKDRYKRTLAIVSGRERSAIDVLVGGELARRWAGRRMPWCS